MFLHVSVCLRGGVVPGHVPPPRGTPPPSPPRTRCPLDLVHPMGPGTPPRTRYTPPPRDQVPPPPETATVADGMHPTGMHSCLIGFCSAGSIKCLVWRNYETSMVVIVFQYPKCSPSVWRAKAIKTDPKSLDMVLCTVYGHFSLIFTFELQPLVV